MIVFGPEEVAEGFDFDDDRGGQGALDFVEDGADGRDVGGIDVVDAGAVAGALVFALLVERGGVDGLEEHAEQELQSDFFIVKADVDRLGVSGGVGVDFLVGGIGRVAVGKAHFGEGNAFDLFEEMLGAPEAAAGQIDIFIHNSLLNRSTKI